MPSPKYPQTISPQCPEGQEDGYKIGYYHGQVDLLDRLESELEMYYKVKRLLTHSERWSDELKKVLKNDLNQISP